MINNRAEIVPMGSAQDVDRVIIEGDIAKVNGIDPDTEGNVTITGANINATVGSSTTTVTSHLTTIKNDLDDLGDQTSGIEEKIPGTASSANKLMDVAGVDSAIMDALDDYYPKTETYTKTEVGTEIDTKIAAKIPSAPTDDGTYKLTCTVTDGVATYSWESAE